MDAYFFLLHLFCFDYCLCSFRVMKLKRYSFNDCVSVCVCVCITWNLCTLLPDVLCWWLDPAIIQNIILFGCFVCITYSSTLQDIWSLNPEQTNITSLFVIIILSLYLNSGICDYFISEVSDILLFYNIT